MAKEISFPFPFPPYDVQKNFMNNLYQVLQAKKIGIFESPTGTGKSLSIICGSLKWLKDLQLNTKRELEEILNQGIDDTDDNWFDGFIKKQEKMYKLQDAKNELTLINEYEEKIKHLKEVNKSKRNISKVYLSQSKRKADCLEDNEDSDDDFLINKENDDEITEVEEKLKLVKIFYASRTHSQLAQFVGEIKKSPFKDNVTITILGSRNNLCINQNISKLKNLNLINDSCMDLQKKTSKKRCPFYKHNVEDMLNNILASVKDIEEIVEDGKEFRCCPYYATRKSIPEIEMVILPYNILLHKLTRDSYGISLKDNIVIIDEAHNLVETINNIHSAEISEATLELTYLQLEFYHKTYNSRFSQKNLLNIKLLLRVLKSFIDYFKNTSQSNTYSKIISCNEFINLTGINNINFFELVKFCEQSLIARKVHAFTTSKVVKGITPADAQKESISNTVKLASTTHFLMQIKNKTLIKADAKQKDSTQKDEIQYKPSAIFMFIQFLQTLTLPTEDGRILVNKQANKEASYLKFLHLNPASHFHDIVKEARSIIIAGGTMQPINDFVNQLFLPAGIDNDQIVTFSCDHVVPSENILALTLSQGPCGNALDYTFKSRHLPNTIKEIGSILLNLCNIIPGGIVCFFPSYEYEEFIFTHIEKNILQAINKKKKIFREPKTSNEVDSLLANYAKFILSCQKMNVSNCTGAILFSIVGGKMSEGINFSDNLGRCIIMIGLPYPNKFSIELQEKMKYLNKTVNAKAGDIYYNNLCMKAVNQSIGRAIRHKEDYASILLLDYRYNTQHIKNMLPKWISRSLTSYSKFGPAFASLKKFFANKAINN